MERLILSKLEGWLSQPRKKPLILRGARQVGKTWLARELARRSKRDLVELNFERNPEYGKQFVGNDPKVILNELSLLLGKDIPVNGSLLLLDEIQAAGDILAKLRWFSEELPELPVVAAGSLLEFTLADHAFSMPVGRVTFHHVEPLGFEEYLMAHGQDKLRKTLKDWRPGHTLSSTAHERAWHWFERFSMVGGLPEVVAADVAGASPSRCRNMQKDLMTAFRADFTKYSRRMHSDILDKVLRGVAASIGRKFVYAQAGEGVKQQQAKRALELLAAARVCHLVRYTPGNGLPLGAETKDTFRKAVLLDVGLLHALMDTPASAVFPAWENLTPDLRGRLAEQTAAQHLRLFDPGGSGEPELFYWQREGGRPGEIDFLVACDGKVVPIELKSGATGSMKSLHQFMHDKGLKLAVRSDRNPPSDMQVDLATTQSHPVQYRLLNVPLYLLWNLPGILSEE